MTLHHVKEPEKYDCLITSYVDGTEHFFNFMKTVLYKQWAEYIHLEKTEKGEMYILVTDLDKIPANVLYNFCICSRAELEFPGQVAIWLKLCEKGIHPAFAWGCLNEKAWQTHWPLDVTASFKCLITGSPVKLSESFKSNPKACTPTNVIWGNMCDLRQKGDKSVEEFWLEWKSKNEEILLLAS